MVILLGHVKLILTCETTSRYPCFGRGLCSGKDKAVAGCARLLKEIGVSPATLSQVEAGKLPDLLTFRKICVWLKIDPAELLDIPSEGTRDAGAGKGAAGGRGKSKLRAGRFGGKLRTPDAQGGGIDLQGVRTAAAPKSG